SGGICIAERISVKGLYHIYTRLTRNLLGKLVAGDIFEEYGFYVAGLDCVNQCGNSFRIWLLTSCTARQYDSGNFETVARGKIAHCIVIGDQYPVCLRNSCQG